MKISEKLKAFIADSIKSDSYWINKAKLAFAVSLEANRKKAGLSYKDMAERMNTSSAYMTKVFRGDANLTIESMVKLARATGAQLHVEVTEQATEATLWDIPSITSIGRTAHQGNRNYHGGRVVLVVNNAANNHEFKQNELLAA